MFHRPQAASTSRSLSQTHITAAKAPDLFTALLTCPPLPHPSRQPRQHKRAEKGAELQQDLSIDLWVEGRRPSRPFQAGSEGKVQGSHLPETGHLLYPCLSMNRSRGVGGGVSKQNQTVAPSCRDIPLWEKGACEIHILE